MSAALEEIDGYRIFYNKFVGQGAYATIYECENKQIEGLLCVKVLRLNMGHADLFKREVAILNKIQQFNHKNLITIYHIAQQNNVSYIFMKKYQSNLEQYLMQKKKEKILLSVPKIFDFIRQIVNGYKQLYKHNIIHRDLKPENILIGTNEDLKISDYGLGKILNDVQIVGQHTMQGTPMYASPQCLIDGNYSSKTDVYSVCIIVNSSLVQLYIIQHTNNILMQNELKRQSHTKGKKPSFRDPLFCTMQHYDEDSEIKSFITSLGDDTLDFIPYIKVISLTANQFLIQSDQYGDEYFGLISGQVNVNDTLFGKESLSNEPYTQDVYTIKDSKFIVIKRQDYLDVINKGKLKDNNQKIDFLKETQLFGKLSKQTIKAMLSYFEFITFKKGQIVYRERENSDFVYLIKEGEFELLKQFVVLEQSKQKLLPVTSIGKFEQFGDLDCLLNNPRQFTVRCKEAAVCLKVSSQNFYAIIQKNQDQIENYVNNLMRVQTLSRQQRLKTASSVVSGNRDILLGVSDRRKYERDVSLQFNIDTKTHSRFTEIYSNSNRKKIKVRYATLHDQQAAVNRCGSKIPETSNRFKQLNQIKGQLFDEILIPDRIKRKYQHQLMDISQQTIRKQQLVIRTQNNCSQIIAQKQS